MSVSLAQPSFIRVVITDDDDGEDKDNEDDDEFVTVDLVAEQLDFNQVEADLESQISAFIAIEDQGDDIVMMSARSVKLLFVFVVIYNNNFM